MPKDKDHEKALVIVKALPEVSVRHGETVCCAGLTIDGEWRRQFPVRFRHLKEDRFKRWQWIEYDWRLPKDDRRKESRRIEEASIRPLELMPRKDRSRFIEPLILNSTAEAANRGDTLTLIRPEHIEFRWSSKSAHQIRQEKEGYEWAAGQLSLFDDELQALTPCPYEFSFGYCTSDGKSHKSKCLDWETTAAFYKLSKKYGEEDALKHLSNEYNERYPREGVAFAMGTHSQHPDTWLLVGIIRVDQDQMAMRFD